MARRALLVLVLGVVSCQPAARDDATADATRDSAAVTVAAAADSPAAAPVAAPVDSPVDSPIFAGSPPAEPPVLDSLRVSRWDATRARFVAVRDTVDAAANAPVHALLVVAHLRAPAGVVSPALGLHAREDTRLISVDTAIVGLVLAENGRVSVPFVVHGARCAPLTLTLRAVPGGATLAQRQLLFRCGE